jgi:glycosyltransferase involved in cell wall biosynthesis
MAALALGRPVVTNFGMNTEGVFERERCVELADDEAGMAERIVALLADAEARRALGARARQIYEARFSLDVAVQQILRLRTVAPGVQVT